MKELLNDIFYQILEEYDECCLDYCLLKDVKSYCGIDSHRKAIQFAMEKCSSKMKEPWISDINKAQGIETDAVKLFYYPEQPWKQSINGTVCYDNPNIDGKIPYWYAFVEPPCGSGPVIKDGKVIRDQYEKEDFDRINIALFPKGFKHLIVYEWTTDWSDYFDAGHEWWGTACWSIYDPVLERYAVILASSTD